MVIFQLITLKKRKSTYKMFSVHEVFCSLYDHMLTTERIKHPSFRSYSHNKITHSPNKTKEFLQLLSFKLQLLR